MKKKSLLKNQIETLVGVSLGGTATTLAANVRAGLPMPSRNIPLELGPALGTMSSGLKDTDLFFKKKKK